MILTDDMGVPFERPSREDFPDDVDGAVDYWRAVWDWKDRVGAYGSRCFAEALPKAMKRPIPVETGRRWSLFKTFDSRKRAKACFVKVHQALGGVAWGRPSAVRKRYGRIIAVLKRLGHKWAVFVRVDRKRLPELEQRILRKVTSYP